MTTGVGIEHGGGVEASLIHVTVSQIRLPVLIFALMVVLSGLFSFYLHEWIRGGISDTLLTLLYVVCVVHYIDDHQLRHHGYVTDVRSDILCRGNSKYWAL